MANILENIVHETKHFWVLKVDGGYDIYRNGITCSTRCAQIGFTGEIGLHKAKLECERRELIINNVGK